MLLVVLSFFGLLWYFSVSLFVAWSSIYQDELFAMQGMLYQKRYSIESKELTRVKASSLFADYRTAVSEDDFKQTAYYICTVLAVSLTLISFVAVIAISRLLAFHIRLCKLLNLCIPQTGSHTERWLLDFLDMTTVEYLNRPRRNLSLDDSDEEDDFEDYYDDEVSDDSDEINWSTAAAGRQNNTLKYQARIMWLSARIVLKRNWHLALRKILPGYHKYRKLTRLRRQSDNPCLTTARYSSTRRTLRLANNKHSSDLAMEELLATTTIRSTESSNLSYPPEPNYDDDMGLDMSLLDEKRSSTPEKRKSSKAARILDITDEEAIRYQQSMQDSRQTTNLVSFHTQL